MLKGRNVVVGITGSIAAYKMADVASALVKLGCAVQVIMTKNAMEFITPYTFERITGKKCITDTFDKNFNFDVEHISIAKKADLLIIAPASANIIAKMANGIADDMLSTVALACRCKKLFASAMNCAMYENEIVKDNIKKLINYGFTEIPPQRGMLACGDIGIGKMADGAEIVEYVLKELAYEKDLAGKNVLVTAGPTQESLDPVRFITNHSSGKMGYAMAKIAMLRGANVTLISGQTSIKPPPFVKTIFVKSAADMLEKVEENIEWADIVFKSAAVADYTPADYSTQKIKKKNDELTINLQKTTDILKEIGTKKRADQFICGFCMETENLVQNAKNKLINKNLDMIAANSIATPGAGFKGDTNVMTIVTKEGETELPIMTKEKVAEKIIDMIIKGKKDVN